jgi:hypothetical protein
MILAALVIGLITAYAYGPRVGLWAAGAALALLLVAALVPAAVLPVYAVVGVGVAATRGCATSGWANGSAAPSRPCSSRGA